MQTNPMIPHYGRGGVCAVVFLLLSAMPAGTFAGAFRIFDHSASGTAQGGAFTAQADDPSAIYFNPAGMAQLHGVQVSIGTLLLGGSTSFTGPTGTTARGDFGGGMAFPPPSNCYITANLKPTGIAALENITAGIGVVSPFGVLYRGIPMTRHSPRRSRANRYP